MQRTPGPGDIKTRVMRKGVSALETWEWEGTTPEERINAVWDLTLLCLAWNQDGSIEPRLQRSVVRIQRARG